MSLQKLRQEYRSLPLCKEHMSDDPFVQFKQWLDESIQAELPEPNAMILSTATKGGIPSSRTVLLKGFDEKGLKFYTNYESQKGRDLQENPNLSVTFLWMELLRQVCIDGVAEKLPIEESEAYFHTRPRMSQINAWASKQGTLIKARSDLDKSMEHYEKEFEGKRVPLPPHWGGYRINPTRFEFWQGREDRCHDRLSYKLLADEWELGRLAP